MKTTRKQIEVCKTLPDNGNRGVILKTGKEDGIMGDLGRSRLVSIAALRRRGFTPESIKRL